jgi:hypothetical protein
MIFLIKTDEVDLWLSFLDFELISTKQLPKGAKQYTVIGKDNGSIEVIWEDTNDEKMDEIWEDEKVNFTFNGELEELTVLSKNRLLNGFFQK